MTRLYGTVNSFDLFDTLLARKCIEPYEILLAVERKLNAVGFAAARRQAEDAMAATGKPFDLYDIYAFLVSAGSLNQADADRLFAAEIEEEFDNAIPIMENLQQVQDGDLIVSDMYLPRDVLRRLLAHVGLRTHVTLLVTNLGKHFGTVWKDIASNWVIAKHTGDHPESDVATPRHHGIPTKHYTGARLSTYESLLSRHGHSAIARLMRRLRLGNPYLPGTQEAELWNLTCQLNLPLLLLYAGIVKEAVGPGKALFSGRDCYFLSELFSTLFPRIPAEYFFVSRMMLSNGGRETVDYLVDLGLSRGLICDIAATGGTWLTYAKRHGIHVRLLTLVFIDNWSDAEVTPQDVVSAPNLSFGYVARSSTLNQYSTAIEVLNTAPHGSCAGIIPAGQFHAPVTLPRNELGLSVLQPILQCHAAAMSALRDDLPALQAELQATLAKPLVPPLIDAISASPLLNALGQSLLWSPKPGQMTN